MKLFPLILSAVICFSCTNSPQNNPAQELTSKQPSDNFTVVNPSDDSTKWIQSFIKFSKAVTSGNKEAVKSFIDFPIKNEGNEIWFLGDPKLVMEIDFKKIKPFTEADFDKYFSSIFALDLRKTLKKLDTDQLFKTHNSASPEIEVVKGSKSKLDASYDKTNKELILLLNNEGEHFEMSIQYQFDITSDQQLKFRKVHVAG